MIHKIFTALNLLGTNTKIEFHADGTVILTNHLSKPMRPGEIAGWIYGLTTPDQGWQNRDDRLLQLQSQGYSFEHVSHSNNKCSMWFMRPGASEWEYVRSSMGYSIRGNWIDDLLEAARINFRPPLMFTEIEVREIKEALDRRGVVKRGDPLLNKINTYFETSPDEPSLETKELCT